MLPFPEELDPDKLYYGIGEVADALDVEKSTLRFWEDEFPELIPSKSPGGQRRYDEDDVRVVLRIQYLLKKEKFTLDGARKKLSNWDSYRQPKNLAEEIKQDCNEALELLKGFRKELNKHD